MASDLKKKTQEAIDTLRNDTGDCSLAMLIDGETGLVLCKSSNNTVSQNELDGLATVAQVDLQSPLAQALSETVSPDGNLLSSTSIEKDAITIMLKAGNSSGDALVCQFTDLPDRAELTRTAEAVFALTSDAEAA